MSYQIFYHGRKAGHFAEFITSTRLDSMKWCEGLKLEICDDRLMASLLRVQRLMSRRLTDDVVDEDVSRHPKLFWRAVNSLLAIAVSSRRGMRARIIEYLCEKDDFVHLYDVRQALGHRCNWPHLLANNPVDVALRSLTDSGETKFECTLSASCFAVSQCRQVLPHFYGYIPVVTREISTGGFSTRFLGMAFGDASPFFRVNAPKDPVYCRACEIDVDSTGFTVDGVPVSNCPRCGLELHSQLQAVAIL